MAVAESFAFLGGSGWGLLSRRIGSGRGVWSRRVVGSIR